MSPEDGGCSASACDISSGEVVPWVFTPGSPPPPPLSASHPLCGACVCAAGAGVYKDMWPHEDVVVDLKHVQELCAIEW